MPARKKPVKNLNSRISIDSILLMHIPRLKRPANTALKKKTFDGEYLSEIVKMAKTKVPVINPNWIALVR
jgi:hypothetical protein